jgi:hypothetical protein
MKNVTYPTKRIADRIKVADVGFNEFNQVAKISKVAAFARDQIINDSDLFSAPNQGGCNM